MTSEEKLRLLESLPCAYVRTRQHASLDWCNEHRVALFEKRECSSYFWEQVFEGHDCPEFQVGNPQVYTRFDNDDFRGLYDYLDDVVCIEDGYHKPIWKEPVFFLDAQPDVPRFYIGNRAYKEPELIELLAGA